MTETSKSRADRIACETAGESRWVVAQKLAREIAAAEREAVDAALERACLKFPPQNWYSTADIEQRIRSLKSAPAPASEDADFSSRGPDAGTIYGRQEKMEQRLASLERAVISNRCECNKATSQGERDLCEIRDQLASHASKLSRISEAAAP